MEAYGVYATIVSLSALFVFADQGLAVAARTLIAQRLAVGDRIGSLQVVRATRRMMSQVILGLIGLAFLLGCYVPWKSVLGRADGPQQVLLYLVPVSVLLMATVPMRALEGMGRTAFVSSFPILGSAWLLATAWIGDQLQLPLGYFLVCAGTVNLLALLVGAMALRRGLRSARGRSNNEKSIRVREVWHSSWPMAIVSVMLSASYSVDPLIISSVLTPADTAKYAVTAKIYLLALTLVVAGAPVLWTHFAAARLKKPLSANELVLRTLPFVAGASILATCLVAGGPTLIHIWLGQDIDGTRQLFWAFGALLLATSAQIVPGTALTDNRSLRFQAISTSAMASVNVPLSIVLAKEIGPAGPVWASTVTLIVLHAAPLWFRVFNANRVCP